MQAQWLGWFLLGVLAGLWSCALIAAVHANIVINRACKQLDNIKANHND